MPETVSKEEVFAADDHTRLYYKTWSPSSDAHVKARLVFVHGFSDHCNAYYDLFPNLTMRGIEVWAFDQRGWGRSVSAEGQRGETGPTTTVLSDIRSFLVFVKSQPTPSNDERSSLIVPLFLMGHSMGGAQVLLLSLLESHTQAPPPLSGILLESPFIALHPDGQPSSLTIFAGKLASTIWPKRQLLQKLDSKNMCRDPQVCRDWEQDDLCHDTGTLEGLAGMMQRAADLTALAQGKKLRGLGSRTTMGLDDGTADSIPIWIGHGTEDRVTSCSMSEALFAKLETKDKTLKLYDGAYHKLHVEPCGVAQEFANDIADWILERTNVGVRRGTNNDGISPKL